MTKIIESTSAFVVLMLILEMLMVLTVLVLFLTSLISCIRHQHDKDRLTWVLIIIFVPLIGPILYFAMARRGRSGQVANGLPPPKSVTTNYVWDNTPPPFDHSQLHDEKYRAASINEALRDMGKSKRKTK